MNVPGVLFILLPLVAQAQVPPPPPPPWLTDLTKIQQELYKSPPGSLDGRVDQAWRAALPSPLHPQFPSAAQMTSAFYQSQGYELKAEQVLRQALAALPAEGASQTRRHLTAQLAAHFEQTQQLVKAAALREQLAGEPLPDSDGSFTPRLEKASLAHLYERMGELEKAEAAWKEIAAQPGAPAPRPGFGSAARLALGSFSGTGRNELAGFYVRQGKSAQAEALYQEDLAAAARDGSLDRWTAAAGGYVNLLAQQQRFDEAAQLSRQVVARLEASSEASAPGMLVHQRRQLANLLTQAGRPGEALALEKETAEAAQSRAPGGPEHIQALASLAERLIQRQELAEAEKVIARLREAGAASGAGTRFHESMAAQMLARVRDLQKRPAEAARLRASAGVPPLPTPPGGSVSDLVGQAQRALFQGDTEAGLALADRALTLAAGRVRTNPHEVSGLFSLAHVLLGRQQPEQAQRIAVEAYRLLEQAPDHPLLTDALGSVISPLALLGRAAEAENALERLERILVAAKGPESPALNAVGHGRIALMQRNQDGTAVIEERKRMLARIEKATGTKSRDSLSALREVAWAYAQVDNWPEEERILSALLDRSAILQGSSFLERAHLLEHMANRAAHHRQFDRALAWIDQAIEIAQAFPEGASYAAAAAATRKRFVQAKEAPPETPFPGASGAPANRGARWFDTERYQRTDGDRPAPRPSGRILIVEPAPVPSPPAPARRE